MSYAMTYAATLLLIAPTAAAIALAMHRRRTVFKPAPVRTFGTSVPKNRRG